MKLMIIGASGHGKVIADIAAKCGYRTIKFLDDNRDMKNCLEYPVVGDTSNIEDYRNYKFVVAIGNPKIREKVQKSLKMKELNIATLVHPEAVIAKEVSIGEGSVVMAGTVINPSCTIGKGCIINTGASIDHDNILEDYVHISVGSHLAGTVSVGKYSWIGAGAIVSNNVSICEMCTVGAGAVVVKDINEYGIYIGVPAKKMKRKEV